MARTTAKSTRAKSKTTKRTTRSASTRTTKATKSKAVVTKVKVTKPVQRNLLTLPNLHIAGAVVLFGLAVAAWLLMQSASYVITSTHQTNDVFLSEGQTVFVSVSRALFDVDIRVLLLTLLTLSLVPPILYLTRLKAYYTDRVKRGRVLGSRWIDLAVSGALMVEIVALLAGITDVMMLKLMGGLVGATAALSWIAERQNNGARQPVWSAFMISLFTGVLPWIAIATTLIHTILYGMVRHPWYVYALAGVTLLGFLLTALNQKLNYKRRMPYETVERNYQLVSILTKSAFAVILIVGFLK